jgi:cytochrome c oxidase assembly protein subunit 15
MRLFHHYARFTLLVGLVLIWWGAAVTTEDVGLAVPDWPLCFGKVNPDGWYHVPALLLEHGHRWIATSIGFLVLGMYFWQFARCKPSFMEAASILLVGAGFLFLVFKGTLLPAVLIVAMAFAWLIMSWIGRRWTLLRGLTTLALFTVIGQAALGGLRVLKMSDPFGISHGSLGQLFFCLLVFIAFASSRTWKEERLRLPTASVRSARWWSALLVLAVFCQLVIGATLRHTQRLHLAASDILTTKGQLFPPTDPADVFVLHLHKYWGFMVAILVLTVAWKSRRWLGSVPRLRWIPPALLIMPVNQVILGIYVILSGKSFWVTNLHVLNGLGILVLTFLIALSVWASSTGIGLVGEASPDKPASVS